MRAGSRERIVGAGSELVRPLRTICPIAAMTAAVCVLAPTAHAATIAVTTTADTVANDGTCSLREALNAAAADSPSGAAAGECPAGAGADTVVLGAAHYTLTRVGAGENTNASGDLDVTAGTLTIAGAGQSATTIDAGGIDRALDVLAGATLTVENLSIVGGKLPAGTNAAPTGPGSPGGPAATGGDSRGAEGGAGEGGGGVRNAGTLTLRNVAVSGNHAGDGGAGGPSSDGGGGGNGTTGGGGSGGISGGGRGGSGGDGGGIFNNAGTLTISDSTFGSNASGAGGGGGTGANGGTGGAGAGNGVGGGGGGCFGGSGGPGGNGGAIATEGGKLEIVRSDIEQNTAGPGGPGSGCGTGGTGGAGAGTGKGGSGGFAFGGDGGEGGGGGGVSDLGGALTLSDTTIASNLAANGGTASPVAVGGDGGADGIGVGKGGGNFVDGGSGGSGGFGGGLLVRSSSASATATLLSDTLADNRAGAGSNGADATHGGNGSESKGGSGGEGGFGGGADFDAPASATNITVTGNTAGSGGSGGAGGSGPVRSEGGGGGEGGFGGGISIEFGSLAHITAIGNAVAAGGAGGPAGTGTQPAAGSPEGTPLGGDLLVLFGGPTVTLSASIVGACDDPPVDGGGNIAAPSLKPCPGLVAAPGLGPLTDNGGPTKTMALLPGSTAVDQVAAPCGTTPDQRGVARPQGAGCDAGAYELAPPDVTTGEASAVTQSSATVAGKILPNARATTWHIDFGTTTAYGSQTPPQTLPGGLAAQAVTATLTGLATHTLIHYRLVATNADGTTGSADATFTTLAPNPAPRFSGVIILKRALTTGKTGHVAVTIACPSTARTACTGTLAMTVKVKAHRGKRSRRKKPKTTTVTLARATFKIAPGKSKSIQLRLGSSGRSLLAAAGHGGLAVTLTATARDASGIVVRTSLSEKLKRSRH
jgi:CSLREA domain-containing protein